MPSSEPMEVHVGVAGLNRGSLKLHTDGRQFQRLSPSAQEYVCVNGGSKVYLVDGSNAG